MSVETIAYPADSESAFTQQTKSLPTEMPRPGFTDAKSLAPISKREPPSLPVANRPTDVAPTANAIAVAPPADTESVVLRAQQAKSLLAELDLKTAIQC